MDYPLENLDPERFQQLCQSLLVKEYLSREGHDPNLAKELFTGMVERVVALVSRVEGTFEFEVQPLREPLAHRLRYARLRSGAHKWWRSQIEMATDDFNRMSVLLPLLTWATTATLLLNADLVDPMLENLSTEEWSRLFHAVRRCSMLTRQNEDRNERLDQEKLPENVGLRFAAVLSERLGAPDVQIIYRRFIKDHQTNDTLVLQFVQREALDVERLGKNTWNPNLELIQHCYALGVVFEPHAFRRHRNPSELNSMSLEIAGEILKSPDRFPGFLVTSAEDRCRGDVASKVATVSMIAESEQWFTTI